MKDQLMGAARLKKNMLRSALVVFLVAPNGACGQEASNAAADDGLHREALTITGENGTLDFMVELALTPPQQSQGLMFREQMQADHGMLFVFQRGSTP